jgi:hypothetical protein
MSKPEQQQLQQINLHDPEDAATVNTHEEDIDNNNDWRNDNDDDMVEDESINDHAIYDHALFYANFNKQRPSTRKPLQSRFQLLCMGVFLVMIVSGIMIGVVASRAARHSNVVGSSSSSSSSSSSDSNGIPSTTTTNHNKYNMDHTIRSVPFDHRHNVEYDGVKLFKNNTNGVGTVQWDAYAKTSEPVTEITFAAADVDYTKHIVLTNHPRAGYEYGSSLNEEQEATPTLAESAVTIGMYRHGEMWLPPNQAVEPYSMADLFILKLEPGTSQITLYKNDAPLARYENPWGVDQPLYAQIWFREPNASVLAVATRHEKQESSSTSGSSSGSTSGQEYTNSINSDGNLRALLRGRMNEVRVEKDNNNNNNKGLRGQR